MPDTLPRAIDLWRVRRELLKRGAHLDVADLIRRARQIQGCAGDLREAEGHLEALRAYRASPRKGAYPQHKYHAETALLSTMTILYVRATAAGSKQGERGSSEIRDALTAEQQLDHDAIVAVRQRALAHVYPEELIDDDRWHDGTVMLVEFEEGWKPAVAGNRVQYSGKLFARLERALPIAIELIDQRTQERLESLGRRVDAVLNMDPTFKQLLAGAPLDLTTFYGSESDAWKAIAIADDGQGYFHGIKRPPVTV